MEKCHNQHKFIIINTHITLKYYIVKNSDLLCVDYVNFLVISKNV